MISFVEGETGVKLLQVLGLELMVWFDPNTIGLSYRIQESIGTMLVKWILTRYQSKYPVKFLARYDSVNENLLLWFTRGCFYEIY